MSFAYPGFILQQPAPSAEQASRFMDDCFAYLFPNVQNEETFLADHEDALLQLRQALKPLLAKDLDEPMLGHAIWGWQQGLAALVVDLLADAHFMLEKDPAAQSLSEVVNTYPGFRAIFHYRMAHRLCQLGGQLLPRMITELAHMRTGIDIHPAARIAVPFCIDHGTGVVIGQTAEIGPRCILYQGVTLGAASVKKELARQKRHPTLEADVVVYANATILGGDTLIGQGCIIGGNTWVTQSVPAQHLVLTVAQHNIVTKPIGQEPINFVI